MHAQLQTYDYVQGLDNAFQIKETTILIVLIVEGLKGGMQG